MHDIAHEREYMQPPAEKSIPGVTNLWPNEIGGSNGHAKHAPSGGNTSDISNFFFRFRHFGTRVWTQEWNWSEALLCDLN